MKKFALLLLLAVSVPTTVHSQGSVVVEVERWVIYQLVIKPLKPLPPGYHHFVPVPPDIGASKVSGDGAVLCREMQNAISFGKRIWLGFSPDAAVNEIKQAWGGDTPCGYLPGLTLTPLEYAVRGDDKGRRVCIVKWVDQYGRLHFTGVPKI